MRFLLGSLVLLAAFPPALVAEEALPRQTLARLKEATVFVKVDVSRKLLRAYRGRRMMFLSSAVVSGSGFLIKVEGSTGYLVTNEHVINPVPKVGVRVGGITVVLHSGTRRERSVGAELVASDPDNDLAVLKVSGLPDLPRPLDLSQPAELAETLPVFVLGFPFGRALATAPGSYPALTVGKGTVSSIREDGRGQVALVQIDGDINPGNSGGPVVDSRGRLVGIAVAHIRGSRIGLAIPSAALAYMLDGRVSAVDVSPVEVGAGEAEMQVALRLIDPLNRVRAAAVHYLRSDSLPKAPQPGPGGVWGPLPGAQKIELKVAQQQAAARFKVTAPRAQPAHFYFQVAYVSGAGKAVFTEPLIRCLEWRNSVKPPRPLAPGQTPNARLIGVNVGGPVHRVDDLKVRDLKLPTRPAPRCLCWTADGKAFYHLGFDGTLRRIDLVTLTEGNRLEVGRRCGWVSTSSVGPVLSVTEIQEAWVLDPITLQVQRRLSVPSLSRVVSSHRLPVGFAATSDGITVLDLIKGTAVKTYTARDFPGRTVGFDQPVVSPDGKYLFALGSPGQLHRFRIEGQELRHEQSSSRIIQGRVAGIDVSPDGARVCVACAEGNAGAKDHPSAGPFCTHLYAVGDLLRPAAVISQGAYPEAVGFDPRMGGLIYAQNAQHSLIVFRADGIKTGEYDLGTGQVRQLLVHSDGRRLIVLGDTKVCDVELPRR